MLKKGGENIVPQIVMQKGSTTVFGLNVKIAIRKFIALPGISENQRVKDFFAHKVAIALGRIEMFVMVLMLQIGFLEKLFIAI